MRRTVHTLLTSQASGEVVRDILGHSSEEMTEAYHHASVEAKREALRLFDRPGW